MKNTYKKTCLKQKKDKSYVPQEVSDIRGGGKQHSQFEVILEGSLREEQFFLPLQPILDVQMDDSIS